MKSRLMLYIFSRVSYLLLFRSPVVSIEFMGNYPGIKGPTLKSRLRLYLQYSYTRHMLHIAYINNRVIVLLIGALVSI